MTQHLLAAALLWKCLGPGGLQEEQQPKTEKEE